MSGFTGSAKARHVNALAIDTMKLHTGYPGLTGANELSGGAPACSQGMQLQCFVSWRA